MFVITTRNCAGTDSYFTGISDYYCWFSPRVHAARLFQTEAQAQQDIFDYALRATDMVIRRATRNEITAYRMTQARGAAVRESLSALMDAIDAELPYSRVTF